MFQTYLSPVQVLFLVNPKITKVQDIFATILQDLTIKKIVNHYRIISFPNQRSKRTQTYNMFSKGEYYESYFPQDFENYFLSPLGDLYKIQAKILINFILKPYSLNSQFISQQIFQPLKSEGYITAPPFLDFFGVFKLTNQGKEVVNNYLEFIEQQELKLSDLIDGDKMQFIKTMNETGTYIFDIKRNNPELFKNIVSMTKRIYRTAPFGLENDLSNFYNAIIIDLSYFEET